MILFSTVLPVRKSLTRELLADLIIHWNQSSSRPENVVPGLHWDGVPVKYGTDELWIEFAELSSKNIFGARHEKRTKDGMIWDTDIIADFGQHKISIILERSFSEGFSSLNSSFSTPHFITLLVEKGYLDYDKSIKIDRVPSFLEKKDAQLLSAIVDEKISVNLPIVFVSKTKSNEFPLDVKFLASRLKGIAHVIVQADRSTNTVFRDICGNSVEYNGAIGIYYTQPPKHHQRFLYQLKKGEDPALLDRIVQNVLRNNNQQTIESLYTWNGLQVELAKEQLLNQKRKHETAEQEKHQFIDMFDSELQEYEQHNRELISQNERLTAENESLRKRLLSFGSEPILLSGNEIALYESEIKSVVINTLKESLERTEKGSRRSHILRDLIENNPCPDVVGDKQTELKSTLKTYAGMDKPTRQKLINLGFSISEEGKHCKLVFYNDGRYTSTLAKTPSDVRGGKNSISEIINKML